MLRNWLNQLINTFRIGLISKFQKEQQKKEDIEQLD